VKRGALEAGAFEVLPEGDGQSFDGGHLRGDAEGPFLV
jgi:hypothetical protein